MGAGGVSGRAVCRTGRGRLPRALLAAGVVVGVLVVPAPPAVAEPVGGLVGAGRQGWAPADVRLPVVGEDVARRSERSATFVQADGSLRTVVSETPVHFRAAGGGWERVDTSVVADGGGWRTAAAGVVTWLPGGADGLVSVRSGDDAVSFRLEGASSAAAARVDGGRLTYPEALPGVDVEYEVRSDGVKETAVLAGLSSPSSLRFVVTPPEGGDVRQAGPAAEVVRGDGSVAFQLDAPYLVDGAGVSSPAATLTVSGEGRARSVVVAADRGWLEEPGRVWPVRLDPTTTVSNQGVDCYVDAGLATTSFCSQALLLVGKGNFVKRALFDFDTESSFSEPAVVRSATLSVKVESRQAGTGAMSVSAHEVTEGFSSLATWNNRYSTTAWSIPGGAFRASATWTDSTVDGPGTGNDVAAFDVTSLVQRDVGFGAGGAATNGVLLKATSEATANLIRVHSKHATSSADRPSLTVDWEPLQGKRDLWSFEEAALSDRREVAVNVASGDLVVTDTDLTIAGTGPTLSLGRVHNSRNERTRDFGGRTTSTVEPRLETTARGDVLLVGDTVVRFAWLTASTYSSPPGVAATLTTTSGQWDLTDNSSREVLHFDANGRLATQTDRNGNVITFGRNGSGWLTGVTDTQGRSVTVTRLASNTALIDTIVDSTGRTWDYDYTGTLLTQVTGPALPGGGTNVTTYGWSATGARLTSITDARGTVTTFAYDSLKRVSSITYADGQAEQASVAFDYTTPWATTVTDARSGDTTYVFDRNGQVTRVTDQLGHTRDSLVHLG